MKLFRVLKSKALVKCDICGREFKKGAGLYAHRRLAHGAPRVEGGQLEATQKAAALEQEAIEKRLKEYAEGLELALEAKAFVEYESIKNQLQGDMESIAKRLEVLVQKLSALEARLEKWLEGGEGGVRRPEERWDEEIKRWLKRIGMK